MTISVGSDMLNMIESCLEISSSNSLRISEGDLLGLRFEIILR